MRLLILTILLAVTQLSAQDSFEVLRSMDDPSLPVDTRRANVAVVAQKAAEQPLLCVELARRIGFRGSHGVVEAVEKIFTTPTEFCAQHLPQTLQVLRATDDDSDNLYLFLTKEELEANREFVHDTLLTYCGESQALVVAVLVTRLGLSGFLDDITECVIHGRWMPGEMIQSRYPVPEVAGDLTSSWEPNYGGILLALRTSDNHSQVDRALKVVLESLVYRREHLKEGEDLETQELKVLEEITAVLGE